MNYSVANLNRRVRRQKLGKERRKKDLLRLDYGHSPPSSTFASETFLRRNYPAEQEGLEQVD